MNLARLLKRHQDLPPDVPPYPTVKGKKRFEMVQAFNLFLAGYIFIHKCVVPMAIFLGRTDPPPWPPGLGAWYLYHWAIAFLAWERQRTPRHAYMLVYLAWFGIGFLPLTWASSFVDHGSLRFGWKALSGTLCYGSSLMLTVFLLNRLRMPTTAYLFHLESRIIPQWRYAVPYFTLGLALAVGLQLLGPVEETKPPAPKPAPAPAPVLKYE